MDNYNWKPPLKERISIGKLSALGFVIFVGVTMYPIFIHPYLHSDYWKKVQKVNRQGIDPEKIQPGDMKVWTNPFDKKKPE